MNADFAKSQIQSHLQNQPLITQKHQVRKHAKNAPGGHTSDLTKRNPPKTAPDTQVSKRFQA